ncbi:MAG: YHS domain-containing protein [Calditrichia bacterium]
MKFFATSVVTLMILLSISFSCSTKKQSDAQAQNEMKMKTENKLNISADMLATAKDLSCGMDLTKYAIADTAVYKGQIYGFCSTYCKDKFKENPEAALAKLESGEAGTTEN